MLAASYARRGRFNAEGRRFDEGPRALPSATPRDEPPTLCSEARCLPQTKLIVSLPRNCAAPERSAGRRKGRKAKAVANVRYKGRA